MSNVHRSVLDTPNPTEDRLYGDLLRMEEPYRSYACFLYLFGTRVSEGIGVRAQSEDDKPVYVTEPLRKDDFEVKDDILWVRNIHVLKRPNRPIMDKYVMMNGPTEKRFIKILLQYFKTKKKHEILWDFTRQKFYRELRTATDLFPHKLRGLRATKDVSDYELNIVELQTKHGWTQLKTPLHYISIGSKDVVKKMKRKIQEMEQ